MTTIEFTFDLQEKVQIKAIGLTGMIDGQLNSILGKEYRVTYWCNSERKNTWMYECELGKLPKG